MFEDEDDDGFSLESLMLSPPPISEGSATEGGAFSDEMGDYSDVDLDDQYSHFFEETNGLLVAEGISTNLFSFEEDPGPACPQVDEEDFDLEDRPIFRALATHLRALVAKNTPAKRRQMEMEWLMSPFPDKNGLLFDDACQALLCRPTILRTRTLYEIWRRGIDYEFSLPLVHRPIPMALKDEIANNPYLFRAKGAADLAKIVWSLPGAFPDKILRKAVELDIPDPANALGALIDYGYVAQTAAGRCFFVARNPSIYSGRLAANFDWSSSMITVDY